MNRKTLIPVLVSMSIAAPLNPANASLTFDFIGRLEFVKDQDLVTKDRAKLLETCNTDAKNTKLEPESCTHRVESKASRDTNNAKE